MRTADYDRCILSVFINKATNETGFGKTRGSPEVTSSSPTEDALGK